jgi:hypothetical protein
MIRDRFSLKKAVFFSPIRIQAAIVKSVKTQVASNACSGTLSGLFARRRDFRKC